MAVSSMFLLVPLWVHAAPPSTDDVQQSITRGANWLQADMRNWRNEHNCGACHHAPLALFSLSAASQVKDAVTPDFLPELTHWSFTDVNARLLPKEASADAKPALFPSTIFVSLGVNALSDGSPETMAVRKRLIQHLQLTQSEDGSWTGPGGRPPVLAPSIEVTLLTLVAWESRRGEFPELAPLLDKAGAWVRVQPPTESHQELALRTLWHASRSEKEPTVALVERLRALQQPDGGWKQAPDEPSDAFATGQTLLALRRAQVSADDIAIQRGVRFLVATQQPDGSWPMTSRPHPENHSRAGNLNPITYAGSAWAVAGLAAVVPQRQTGRNLVTPE